MSENIQETTATENENKNNSTQEVKVRWEQQLGGFEEFQVAVDALIDWTNELQTKTLGEVFESKAKKSAPFSYQMLAILTHQSAGYVGDKFRGKTTVDEQVSVVAELIAPELTPEQVKARNYQTAVDALATLRGQNVPEATIAMVISAMPEGKRALADNK